MHLSAMFQSPSNNTCTLKSLLCRQNPAGVFYLFPSSAWASSTLWQSLLTPARHVRCTPVASPLAPQCLTCVPTFPGNTAILTSYRHQSISMPGPLTACPTDTRASPRQAPQLLAPCTSHLLKRISKILFLIYHLSHPSNARQTCLPMSIPMPMTFTHFSLISVSCCNLIIVL